MLIFLETLLGTLSSMFRSRVALELENLALRHQIGVLQRSARKRPKLIPADRLLWVWLSRIRSDWRLVLAIVKPETVVAWHRAGFRRFWTWKVRRGQAGRPAISHQIRVLIRQMCRENSGWGAPRIHGELPVFAAGEAIMDLPTDWFDSPRPLRLTLFYKIEFSLGTDSLFRRLTSG